MLRAIAWGLGLLIGAGLAYHVARDLGDERLALGVFLSSWLVVGLAGNVLDRVLNGADPGETEEVDEARPADGRVDIMPLVEARSVPNPTDPRFRRFLELTPLDVPQPSTRQGRRRRPPALRGRIVLFSLYVGRDGISWSDAEVARAQAKVERAAAWIEREAQRWKVALNVDLCDTYFVADDMEHEDVAIGPSPERHQDGLFEIAAEVKAIRSASCAAVALGFLHVEDLFERIAVRVTADQAVWLLQPRRAGRSIAIPLDAPDSSGISLAVCYARETDFPEPLTRSPLPDPVTYAHEILHLFGAQDKYGGSLREYPRGSVTRFDVMVDAQTSLSRLRIDALTARELGWTN